MMYEDEDEKRKGVYKKGNKGDDALFGGMGEYKMDRVIEDA